jgi:hypothetical protein
VDYADARLIGNVRLIDKGSFPADVADAPVVTDMGAI